MKNYEKARELQKKILMEIIKDFKENTTRYYESEELDVSPFVLAEAAKWLEKWGVVNITGVEHPSSWLDPFIKDLNNIRVGLSYASKEQAEKYFKYLNEKKNNIILSFDGYKLFRKDRPQLRLEKTKSSANGEPSLSNLLISNLRTANARISTLSLDCSKIGRYAGKFRSFLGNTKKKFEISDDMIKDIFKRNGRIVTVDLRYFEFINR